MILYSTIQSKKNLREYAMPTKNLIRHTSNRFGIYTKWIIDHRLLAIIVLTITGLVCGYLASRLVYNFDQSLFCPEEIREDYDSFLDEYGNDEFIFILYKTDSGIFSVDTLKKTRRLVGEIEKIPYIKKVNSITNIEFMEGSKDGDLKIKDFMEDMPETQTQAELLKKKLLEKPVYINTYITPDANYAAIFCEIEEKPEEDTAYQRKIKDRLYEIIEKPEYSDFTFYTTGNPVLAATFYDLNNENMIIFTLFAAVLITIILALSFHQLKAIAAPFIVVFFADLLIFGFMSIMDMPLTLMTSMIPSLLLGIGIATTVHVLSEYQIHLGKGEDNNTSIIEAIKLVGFPCLFTSITTGIGFGSLATSSMKAVKHFGISIGLGALAVFASAFTVLIVLLTLWGKRTEKKFHKSYAVKSHKLREAILQKVACWNINHYKFIITLFIILSVALIYGATKIEVNSSTMDMLGDEIEITKDMIKIDETLGSSGNFEILLESKEPEGIKTVKFTDTLEKIQAFADSKEYIVNKTFSVNDIIKDVNSSMNNNSKKFYRIPDGDNMIAQYLLLYEFSGGKELERMVSADLSTARLTIYVKAEDSNTYINFYNDIKSYIESVIPEEYSYKITGHSFMDVSSAKLMIKTMTNSLALAIIVICIIMIIVFRSFKIGFLSMVPNIFPVLFALGFLGLSGIWLSNITSTVGCIVIGLAVDDTIHFISRYRMEFERLGNYKTALKASMSGVGHALFITTAILVIGFGVFMASRMNVFYHAGMLNSICLFIALVADFFLAPSLILVLKPFGKEREALEV